MDVHPLPKNPWVDVVGNEGTHSIGAIDWTDDCRDIRRARRRLSKMEALGLFVRERRVFFDLAMYHDSVDAWLEFRRQHGATSIIAADMLGRARKALGKKGAQLVVRERVRATSFRSR